MANQATAPKAPKGNKDKKATNATAVKPTGEAVATTPAKTKRLEKNHTVATLDPHVPESAATWLKEFDDQCKKHPALKGYDQHWNNLGFIHNGPATRLGNQGAARMFIVLADIFAQRINAGDNEAKEFFNFCITFAKDRTKALKAARDQQILAAAASILDKK